jgi:hypothetical protein
MGAARTATAHRRGRLPTWRLPRGTMMSAAGRGARRLVTAVLVIAVAMAFAISAWGPALGSATAPPPTSTLTFTTPGPSPRLETNVTEQVHDSGWGTLGYENQTGALHNLSAILDPHVTNPISVNMSDVQSGVLQGNDLGASAWQSTSSWTVSQPASAPGAVDSLSTATVNGETAITESLNTTDAGAAGATYSGSISLSVPTGKWPSTVPANVWVAIAYDFSGPTCPVSGDCYASLSLANESTASVVSTCYPSWSAATGALGPCGAAVTTQAEDTGGPAYWLVNLGTASIFPTSAADFNVTGAGKTTTLTIRVGITLPKTATAGTYSATVQGAALSATPIVMGLTTWHGALTQRTGIVGEANLTTLSPTFTYSEVADGGFSLAVEQGVAQLPSGRAAASLITLSSSNPSSHNGTYAGQVSYAYNFSLPASQYLSYHASAITDTLGVNGTQYQAVSVNGVSVIANYTGSKADANVTAASPVNPTDPFWSALVSFTAQQWNEIINALNGAGDFINAVSPSVATYVAVGILALVAVAAGVLIGEDRQKDKARGSSGRHSRRRR